MKQWTMLVTSAATLVVLAGAALAQQPKVDCRANTPAKIDGQVVSVDQAARKITVREKDGKLHQFQARPEMMQTMKSGDKIEAKLREAPKC